MQEKEITELRDAALKKRQPHEPEIKDCYRLICPIREFRQFSMENAYTAPDHSHIYDATAVQSSKTLVNNTISFMLPERAKWTEFSYDSTVSRRVATSLAPLLETANNNLHTHFTKSTFYMATEQALMDRVIAGTQCVAILDETGKPLTYKPIPIDELLFLENHEEQIDCVFRCHRMMGRHILLRFPKLPAKWKKEFEDQPTKYFKLTERVIPDGARYYHCISIGNDKLEKISDGKMWANPFIVSRWEKIIGHPWGSSPARAALPEIKVAQAIIRDTLKYGAFAANGLWYGDDENINLNALREQITPGGYVTISPGTTINPFPFPGQFNLNFAMAQGSRDQIKVLMLDSTPPPAEQLQYMKRAAVQLLREKWANSVGGAARRLQREYLTPMAEQTAARLIRRGELISLSPAQLAALGIQNVEQLQDKITLDVTAALRKLLKLQKASEDMAALGRAMQLFGPEPVFRTVKVEKVIPELLTNMGFSQGNMRSDEEIAAYDEQRAQQAQAQQGQGLPQIEELNPDQGIL